MTYGVPYSFVPGTKAKADEVNANFIDILNKIEDTNSRIDDANTKSSQELKETKEELNAEIGQKADLNFSNIGTNAKAMFSAKANNTDIDGKWVKNHSPLHNLPPSQPDKPKTFHYPHTYQTITMFTKSYFLQP